MYDFFKAQICPKHVYVVQFLNAFILHAEVARCMHELKATVWHTLQQKLFLKLHASYVDTRKIFTKRLKWVPAVCVCHRNGHSNRSLICFACQSRASVKPWPINTITCPEPSVNEHSRVFICTHPHTSTHTPLQALAGTHMWALWMLAAC